MQGVLTWEKPASWSIANSIIENPFFALLRNGLNLVDTNFAIFTSEDFTEAVAIHHDAGVNAVTVQDIQQTFLHLSVGTPLLCKVHGLIIEFIIQLVPGWHYNNWKRLQGCDLSFTGDMFDTANCCVQNRKTPDFYFINKTSRESIHCRCF